MPPWLVKASTSSAGWKLPVILTVALASVALLGSVTVRPASTATAGPPWVTPALLPDVVTIGGAVRVLDSFPTRRSSDLPSVTAKLTVRVAVLGDDEVSA